MRITYIHQHFKHPSQAGGTRSWEFARRMVRDGHTVHMVAGGPCPGVDLPPGLDVTYVPTTYSNSMTFARRIASFVSFMLRASVVAARRPTDVVFATSTPLTVAVPARVASVVQRVPYVFEVRDVWPAVPIALGHLRSGPLIALAKGLERWAYRGSAGIVALSDGMAADIAKVCSGTRVAVIPNGSDISLFDLTSWERRAVRTRREWSRPTLVYAGSLGRLYDPLWLVDYAVALSAHDVDLIIVGEGAMLETCRQRAEAAGLDVLRTLPGPQAKDEVARAVAASDGCVSSVVDHPAIEAASLNKAFDAFAAGRPLFLNHGGWLTELCEREGAGWRVSRDPALAAAFTADRLRAREELLISGESARRLARRHFDRESLYGDLMNELTGAVARPRKRALRPQRLTP